MQRKKSCYLFEATLKLNSLCNLDVQLALSIQPPQLHIHTHLNSFPPFGITLQNAKVLTVKKLRISQQHSGLMILKEKFAFLVIVQKRRESLIKQLLNRAGCSFASTQAQMQLNNLVQNETSKLFQCFDPQFFQFIVKKQFSCIASFQNELKLLPSLSHPAISKIYRHSLQPPSFHTDYCELGTLSQFRNKQKYSSWLVLSRQLLSALAYVHSEGLVHKQINPQNIMVRRDILGKIQFLLTNFQSAGPPCIQPRHPHSTLYQAPQSLQNNYNFSSDVFSAGLILLQVFSQIPFSQKIEFEQEIEEEKLKGFDKQVGQVLRNMLRRSPQERINASNAYQQFKKIEQKESRRKRMLSILFQKESAERQIDTSQNLCSQENICI